ncbi:MAG TPA: hypothetical protein VF624_19180 [Tepidisphaeraceae bacterium]|jgi:4-amino-4-deoxy-L-arabinose transferase-like glycosyltransferase
MHSTSPRLPLILLLLTTFVLRLGWSLSRPVDDASLRQLPDQVEYLAIARNVLKGSGFVFFDEGFQQAVVAYRMPGYPLLVAACGAKVPVVRIVQCLIDASAVLAVYGLARRPLGRGAALLAGAMVAFNPYLVYFSSTLLSETLFGGLLVWGMLGLVHGGRLAWWGGAVMLLAAIYVRPSAIALPALLAAAAPLVRPPPPRPATAVRRYLLTGGGLAMLLLTIGALLPWALRNRALLGEWVWTTTNGGITAYDGLNPRADGSSSQGHFRNWTELKLMNEVARSNYLSALARTYAAVHSERLPELMARKFGRLWSPVPLSSEFGSRPVYVAAGLAYAAPVLTLTLVGLLRGGGGRSLKMYVLLPAVYFTLVHMATVGSLRYRVPADIPMAVVAASGATVVLNRLRSRS